MKVKIKKSNYFYHPPRGKDGKKKPVEIVPAGCTVDVSEAEAKRLALLGVGEIVNETKTSNAEKPKAKANPKPKNTVEEGDCDEAADDDSAGDIVV